MIKMAFKHSLFVKEKTDRFLLLYGVDANAISVANALNSENPLRFLECWDLLIITKKKYAMILGLPYLTILRVYHYLRSLGGEVLIIADKELTKEDLLTVADDCLKYNFKMYSVPSIIGCVNRNEIL
jgi:FlaA1/EpsC-like NDP-sugar epimerase